MDGLENSEELHPINTTGTDDDVIWQNRNDSEKKENGLLSETWKARLVNTVNQLIKKYGKNIDSNDENYIMSQCNEIMDYAWENKLYGDVLVLLEADCQFPTTFDINQLNDNNEDEKELKLFVERRNQFHTFIKHNNLKEIQLIASERKSRFYLSDKNVSACYFAIEKKRFNIYAYLVSEGAEFLNDHEKSILQYLKIEEKWTLAEANVLYSLSISDSHILYLTSKSRSQKPVKNLKQKLYHFYSELDKTSEVSVILKLMQHSDYLDIIFDFDAGDVSTIQPMSSKHTKGETRYKDGRLFIAASTEKRGEKAILGTIIHELTHMAMEFIFQNDCNPYQRSDRETAAKFDLICSGVKSLNRSHGSSEPWETLQSAINFYEKEDHHSELIARVPHIMAEFENGKQWLEYNVPDLLEFYRSQVIKKCHEVLGEIQYFKSTIAVRKLNESIGEIIKFKKLPIFFQNVDHVKKFVENKNKKILIFKTENTHLGMIKILQGIYGEKYDIDFDKYLAFQFQNLMLQFMEVLRTFSSALCDTLAIQFHKNNYKEEAIYDFFRVARELFTVKPNKRIFIIIHTSMEERMEMVLRECGLWGTGLIELEKDTRISLSHLNENSQENILLEKVIFQGKEMPLHELLVNRTDCGNLITDDIIENFIEGEKFYIGDNINDHLSFGETNIWVNEKICLKTFINNFTSSRDTFVFKGLKEDDLINLEELLTYRDRLLEEMQTVTSQSFENTKKRLLFTNRLWDENIKAFCEHNKTKRIYFFKMENSENDEKILTLQQFYAPNYYSTRKLKMIMNQVQLEELISEYPRTNFIISLDAKLCDFELKKDHSNVTIQKLSDTESIINEHVSKSAAVHWFHAEEENAIYWKYSSEFESEPKLNYAKLKTDSKFLITEKDVINHLLYKKIIIIADDAGTGKSATLSKLYQSRSISATHWVFRINLKEHIECIRTTDLSHINDTILTELLQKIKPYLKNKLGENLFKLALKPDTTFTKRLLFAFDGFDDIFDEGNREKIIALIKYLKTIPEVKIMITTSFLYKTKLENELETFAFQFQPLSDEEKLHFIKNYLEHHVPEIIFPLELAQNIGSKIEKYAKNFLEYIRTYFKNELGTFIDYPLQLKKMAEYSLKHFKNWVIVNDETPNFEHLGKNFMEIYEKFNDRKSEITYLVSKSESTKEIKGFKDIVHNYYSKLGDFMELSPILKVVQYSDFLSIKFNFHENNTVDETNYKEGKICIAANPNRGEKQILGTIAYKLTQMAMEILFENECKPYRRAEGDLATEYENVKQAIAESVKTNSHDSSETSINPTQLPTQLDISIDTREETIGTFVRILVEHEHGKKWLKDVFPTWFNFYVDKVIPKCREFIDKSHILKPRNAIRKINETLGDIMKLKNLIIAFENVNIVRTFISNEDKKIFVLRTQFTHMGMIKIIQEIFGRDYVEEFDKYFALSFENLMSQSGDILQAFQSDASDILIVRVSRFVSNAQLQVFIDKIPKILQRKPKKKIIFVVHPNAEEEIKKILMKSNFDERHKLWDICEEKKDTILSLYDLHEDSKKRILSKDVIFQGMKITLNELIGTNRNLQELLKEDTLEQLFEEKEVFIGSKTYEHFNFQRACTSVNEEINIKTLINDLKYSDVIFAIKGSEGLNDKEKLLHFFQEHITDDSKIFDTLAGQIHLINSAKFEFNHKKLLLRNPHLDINIKKFCQYNREKKVCFIDVKRVQNKRVLVLKEFYNPSFYLNRKFKMLQVNWDVLRTWISELPEEQFVLSKETEVCLNLEKTGDNVEVTDFDQARKRFNGFMKNEIVGHWFHAEESDQIFWIDSYGSIKDLRLEIQYKLRKNKQLLSLIDENDIVKQLVHKKVLIIADDPGMGKSTTLTKLYDSPLIAKSHWIIRIDLEMHKEVIKKIQLSDFSTKRIINILQEMNNYLKDKLTEDLLESALTELTFPKLLLLVFDGFDEIKDKADSNKIVFILKYLQKNTRSKIWVTTRFEHQNELEEKLCSLALEFEPIDDESRKTYMARYLKDRLKLTLDVDLGRLIFSEENEACSKIRKIYVEKFFDYISSIFGKDMAKYMGAPYQLNLMFEKCLNHCKKWIESKTWMQNDEELDFSFLGKEKIELLEKNSNWEFNEL